MVSLHGVAVGGSGYREEFSGQRGLKEMAVITLQMGGQGRRFEELAGEQSPGWNERARAPRRRASQTRIK